MKIQVVNLTTAAIVIVGLGTVPASGTEEFSVCPDELNCDGVHPLKVLRELEAAEDVTYEVILESEDRGMFSVHKFSIVAADLAGGAAALTDTFTDSFVFPVGAKFIGGRVVVDALVTNSDADFATSVVSALIGTKAIKTGLNILSGSGALGPAALNGADAIQLLDIGGLSPKLTFTNTGAGAFVSLDTAGGATFEVIYAIL